MDVESRDRLSYRARRIEQGMNEAVAGLEIRFSVDERSGRPINTMVVGPYTVYENLAGVWSGHSEKIGRDKRAVYGRDEDVVGYSDYIFWQMACAEIVDKILSNLPAETTRRVFPEVAHLRGYELAHALRRAVIDAEKRDRSRSGWLRRLVG